MLCLDMRLMQRLRGERTPEDQAARDRDRSKSVCVTSFRSKPPRDVSAFKLFHRRASSAISTASDLISRRGVFSRRYYGSVEQLQQPEVEGQEHSRRFRIENGDSPGEKDEVRYSTRQFHQFPVIFSCISYSVHENLLSCLFQVIGSSRLRAVTKLEANEIPIE
ncbi:hypothetical protein JTB14_028959 [Gonioctena quinquepunctata]|nr:hypothetical protein JTB14_028959 [Gonioctena quinquepunctata]